MNETLFSQAWVDSWRRAINASEDYRRSAVNWTATVGLLIESGDETEAILLDLEAGTCREARRVPAEELGAAEHVLAASEPTWKKLLDEGHDLVWAMMTGDVKLARGSLTGLMPYAAAARHLLSTAREIDLSCLTPGRAR